MSAPSHEAPLDDVLKAWQGLGYYSRARNLHRAAQAIAFERGSVFPAIASDSRVADNPGNGLVGPTTLHGFASPLPLHPCLNASTNPLPPSMATCSGSSAGIGTSKTPSTVRPIGRNQVEAFATEWIHPTEAGTHNQAVMELGALICKPTSPRCTECPLEPTCLNAQLDSGGTPVPPVKQGKTKVKSVQLVFHVVTNGSHVWMRQRPRNGAK